MINIGDNMETFNLTIKFDTEKDRDLALDEFARFQEAKKKWRKFNDDFEYDIIGWYYSENDGKHFSDAERQVI
jgi:hypothetical protein